MNFEIIIPVIFASLVFITGTCWGFRSRYLDGYRAADVNMLSNAQLAEAAQDNRIADAHRDAAKMWLSVSEDYRRFAVYLSHLTSCILVSTLLMLFSALLIAFGACYISWAMFGGLSGLLLLLAAMSLFFYWGIDRLIFRAVMWFLRIINKASLILSASDIEERWVRPRETIANFEWLGDHLEHHWEEWLR